MGEHGQEAYLLVRGSDPVLNGSARFGPTPDPEPDRRSGSAPTPNPGPNFGPVRGGSGPDQGSEPNCGNTSLRVSGSKDNLIKFWDSRIGTVLTRRAGTDKPSPLIVN